MKRKLVFFILCFFAGAGASLISGASCWVLFVVLVLALVLFCLFCTSGESILIVALLFFYSGFLIFALNGSNTGIIEKFEGKWVKAEGMVVLYLAKDKLVVDIDRLAYRGVETGYKGRSVLFIKGEKNIR